MYVNYSKRTCDVSHSPILIRQYSQRKLIRSAVFFTKRTRGLEEIERWLPLTEHPNIFSGTRHFPKRVLKFQFIPHKKRLNQFQASNATPTYLIISSHISKFEIATAFFAASAKLIPSIPRYLFEQLTRTEFDASSCRRQRRNSPVKFSPPYHDVKI